MPPDLQSLKRRQGDIGSQVREAALGQHRESRSPWRLLTSTVRVGLAPHHHASDSADWHQANASPVLFPMPGGWVTPPAELEGKGMKISIFFLGDADPFQHLSSKPSPQQRIQPSLHQFLQVWSGLGYAKIDSQPLFGIWEGKGTRERRNSRETDYKNGHQIRQGEIKRAVELRVTQTLEEGHRKKVTRLEKGLRRRNSVSFPSLLALAFQTGRKYLIGNTAFPDKLGTIWKWRFPYSLQSFENCLLPTYSNQRHQNLCGVWKERLFLTQICSHFAETLLTPSSNDQTSTEAVGLHLIL